IDRREVTILPRLGERLRNDTDDPRWRVGSDLGEGWEITLHDVGEDLDVALLVPHPTTGNGFPDHDAGCEDVGARIDITPDLLRRHVRRLAVQNAGARLHGGVQRLREAEVDELDLTVVGDEDVLWGRVAVDNPERRPIEISERVRVVQT